MAAPTEVYVDPSINANSGSGTIGSPYGDLQYALNTKTRDATNGDRFNIKAGTAEVLTAALSLATYGSPSFGSPLIIQGYTSAANDGGIGEISGAGTYAIYSGNASSIILRDMRLGNCGAADVVTLNGGSQCSIVNVEFQNSSGNGLRVLGSRHAVYGCHFHDLGNIGCEIAGDDQVVFACYCKNDGIHSFTSAIKLLDVSNGMAFGNIVSVSGSSNGILCQFANHVVNNSVMSSGGTGTGILINNDSARVLNNIVDGFSGSGGIGIRLDSGQKHHLLGFNAVYNCATAYSLIGDVMVNLGDNETLSDTPFAKSGADSYANKFTYFAPVDTGNVLTGYQSGSNVAKGAVQNAGGSASRPQHPMFQQVIG
mgnify:CR=1 FL=1